MGLISETIRNIKYPNKTGIPLPPKEQLMWSGHGHFIKVGSELLKTLQFFGLKATDTVLDLGCGNGRTAFALTQYLRNNYLGLDISKDQINWCINNITPKYPLFQFKHLNVYNKFYNPNGQKLTKDFKLPAEDNAYDFIILTSVFTHMLPSDVEMYMKEIYRVLKPEGIVFITYFLLNIPGTDKAAFTFPHRISDFCYVEDKNIPEAVVGYDFLYIKNLYRKANLKIFCRYSGHWRDGIKKQSNSFQDIIVAVK